MMVRTLVVVVAIAANAVFAITWNPNARGAKNSNRCESLAGLVELSYLAGLPSWDFAVKDDKTIANEKMGWSLSRQQWEWIRMFETKCDGVVDYENFANDSASIVRAHGEKAWNGKYGVKGKSIHTIKADGRKKWGK